MAERISIPLGEEGRLGPRMRILAHRKDKFWVLITNGEFVALLGLPGHLIKKNGQNFLRTNNARKHQQKLNNA